MNAQELYCHILDFKLPGLLSVTVNRFYNVSGSGTDLIDTYGS